MQLRKSPYPITWAKGLPPRGNRWSDPCGFLANPHMNFDHFHQPHLACGHLLVLGLIVWLCQSNNTIFQCRQNTMPGHKATHASHQQYDQQMQTRWYHSRMLIRPSLGMRAFSISLALYTEFYMPPDPHGPTATCCCQD